LAYKRRGTGNYSMMSLQAIERAESMQALALDRIKQDFGTAESFDVSDGMSYADFVRALTEAEEQGTRDEFEAMLGRQFMGNDAAAGGSGAGTTAGWANKCRLNRTRCARTRE
jgi:hypothetical protein